jgi:hypothetical protein
MSQLSKRDGKPIIWFILVILFIGATIVWFGSRPYLILYGYAPLVFTTSPTPPHSQLIGKETVVDRECHITDIRGYYATSTPWEDVIALYRSNGFSGAGFTNQYGYELLVSNEGTLHRHVSKINVAGQVISKDTSVPNAVKAAISNSQNVYEFYLKYIEDKEGYAQCRRARD